LVAEGQPAIEPLIECVANDPRLTRSFGLGSYGQDTTQHRPRGVGEAAAVVLSALFGESFCFYGYAGHVWLSATPDWERKALAAKMRKFYDQDYRLTRYERCYRILMDDRAPLDEWYWAANLLCADANSSAAYVFPHTSRPPGKLTPRANMLGEPLR